MAEPSSEVRTLWLGDVESWMDENYVQQAILQCGQTVSVKLIRDKSTNLPAGYGFVDFPSHDAARAFMETYNGSPFGQSGRAFRLNWASFGTSERRLGGASGGSMGMGGGGGGSEHSVFVGDLSADVTDQHLMALFGQKYTTVRSAKVVCDPSTGLSRGYGFVRFADEGEKNRAMHEMQGVYCGSRPMRISTATPKKQVTNTVPAPMMMPMMMGMPPPVPVPAASPMGGVQQAVDADDPTNTTIFVGGLDPFVDEATLRATFMAYGELVYVKIPTMKGCGFVQFVHRACAEAAFALHGGYIGSQRVRLSWGRSPLAVSKTGSTPGTAATPSTAAYPASATYDANSQYASYYGAYNGTAAAQQPVLAKVIDFTQPPDINEMNEEYIDRRTHVPSFVFSSRQANRIVADMDGPDPILIA